MAIGIKYSTGPVENSIALDTLPGISRIMFAKALNNGSQRTRVTVRLFSLNGAKVLVDSQSFTLNPGASGFVELNVADLVQFEVQFIVRNRNVLVTAWGKNRNGNPIAVHRFTQNELKRTFIDL